MNRPHLVGALLAALTNIVAPDVRALTLRTCGPDPIANTADVLCAPPSGPCDAGTVVLSASITVNGGACRFDLGGRALRVERTLQMPGNDGTVTGELRIANAGDITVAKHGRLKARGDLVRRGGIARGGVIELTSTGTIRVAGTLDVSGDSAGRIVLTADGDLRFEPGAKIRGNGISSFADLGKRSADGGVFYVESRAGNIEVAASLQLRGANGAFGGDVDLEAARSIVIRGKADVSGGADGGSFQASPGDDLTIVRASIDARSRGAGGDGGIIWLIAGNDSANDSVPGGTHVIDRAILDARGSANDEGFEGTGGWIETNSHGPVHISNVIIRADGATSPDNPDGTGGSIFMDSISNQRSGEPGPEHDLHVDGFISARGGRRGGEGGSVEFYVEGDLDLQATMDVGGKDLAGFLIARAGGDLTVGRTLYAQVERPYADAGFILLRAGMSRVGALTVAADVLATGGTTGRYAPQVTLEGCPISIADGLTIDAGGDIAANGLLPARLDMISGRPLQLGAGSRYLAGPSGQVTVFHPPLLGPMFGSGTVFDPAPYVDSVASAALFPTCPRCGAGPGDACAPEVRIDAVTPAGGAVDATVAVSSPVGLPLTGDVTVCDGTGIEELTYTVLAESCDDHEPIELLLNDVVVATASPTLGACFGCGSAAPTTYTIPLDDVRHLLAPGLNRLGIRRSFDPHGPITLLYWAYATVTANGVAERVPLFDSRDDLEPFGTSHLDVLDTCHLYPTVYSVDAGADVHLCTPVAATTWSGTLPCGLDLSALEWDHDYTLMVRAADGVVTVPSVATRDFTHGTEGTLSVNGATCP